MLDHAVINAINSEEAHWRMQYDLALAWLPLNTINPLLMGGNDRFLILRRYKGNKYPQPEVGAGVGFARNASTVGAGATTVYSSGDTYWHFVDIVSAAGVVSDGGAALAKSVLWSGLGSAGAMPNRPLWLELQQANDGSIVLSWLYDSLDEEVEPASFEIYTDSGTGTFSGTAHASVAFEQNRRIWVWQSAVGVGNNYRWQVRAKSAGGVQSWPATTPAGGVEQQVGYSVGAVDSRLGVSRPLITSSPATPVAPEFAQ